MSFRAFLSLVLFCVLLPAFFVPAYLTFRENIEYAVQAKIEYRERLAESLGETIDQYLYDLVLAIRADAKIPQLYRYLRDPEAYDDAELNELLRTVILKDAVFVTSAGILNLEGKILQDTDARMIGFSEADDPTFKLYSNRPGASVVADYGKNQEQKLVVASPIRDADLKLLGFLRIRIEPAKIQSIVHTHTTGIPQTYRILVETEQQQAIADLNLFSDQSEITDKPELVSTFAVSNLPWTVKVFESPESFREPQRDTIEQFYRLLAFLLVVIVALSFFFGWIVMRPVKRLTEVVESIRVGDKWGRSQYKGLREFNALSATINEMADRVDSSIQQLEAEHQALELAQLDLNELNDHLEARVQERTEELEAKNEEMRLVMSRLVQNEKMASLGSLVAGISHELNTPIGISVTASTDLQVRIRQLEEKFRSGQLARSDFEDFISDANTAINMLVHNNSRAIELIRSFKEVSIDQTSDRFRDFVLGDVIAKSVTSLQPLINSNHFSLDVSVEPDLQMFSYPGAIEQILTNLITNSIAHGFDGKASGRMVFTAKLEGNMVHITYSDDGVGMSEAHMKRIFEPFFTTKLGQGGSGMGMYILFNLVTKVLNGHVEVTSQEGAGVQFDVRLPQLLKDKKSS